MKKFTLLIASIFSLSLFSTSASAVSCKSFSTQAEAQAYFNKHGAKNLDRDHDGIACENNVGGKKVKSKKAKKSGKKYSKKTLNKTTTTNNPF